MNISQRTEDGLRALIEITRSGGAPVKRKDIAKRQNLPLPFLTQILQSLVKGKIIVSLRGPDGGYVLSRRPEETSLLDVINLLQGVTVPRFCIDNSDNRSCQMAGDCALMGVWIQLRDAGESVLKNITLKDISVGTKQQTFIGLAGG